MQSLKRRLLVLICLFYSGYSYGQQTGQPVKLKDLLLRVDQRAPALLTDSASINIRKAQAAEIRGNWLPNLKLNYQADIGTNNNTAGPYLGFGIIPSNSRGVRTESNISASLTNLGIAAFDWEIYNFGSYGAQNKVATGEINIEQNKFNQSKFQLEAYTIGNYVELSRLEDYLEIQNRNIQRNTEIRRSIQSLAKSGVRPGVDTSIAEAELSKARLNYIELDNQYRQVQLRLAALSGIPARSIVPDTAASSRIVSNNLIPVVMSADTANHPLINYYKSIYQNSLQREDLVRKQYNPKILLEAAAWSRGSSIDANDRFNSLSSGWGFDRSNYLVGIGVSYNLFDLRRKQLSLRTQKAVSNYAQKQLDEQKESLALSVNQADAELLTARQRLLEIPKQLKAANAGYRQKLSLYKSGLTDIIELNAALNILYRAETDYIEAKYAYTSALFQKAVTGNQVSSMLNLLN